MARSVLGVAISLSLVAACGAPPNTASEAVDPIIGVTKTSAVPAVGSITFDGDPYCTGTLIGPRQVLTAAHCLEEAGPNDLEFLTGMTVNRPTGVYGVADFVMHPDYDPYSLDNDIGYLVLEEDAKPKPIGLLTSMNDDWEGRTLLFMGYGVNNGRAQTGDGVKRQVRIRVETVDPDVFLFGDSDANICDGDSGGPSLFRDSRGDYLVAGVTSAGDRSCRRYGVHVRVDQHLDFLAEGDPCGGESYAGRCDGDVLVWCEDGSAWEYNCGDDELRCGRVADGYDCID